MRYLDIPDLPIRAFMHNGIKGKICFYKGGGDVVDWANDQLDSAPNIPQIFDQQVIQPVSNEISNATQTVGDVGNQIDKAVNDNIPGGWALPVIITTAIVAPELAPELFDSSLAAAPELDATGTLAEQGATTLGTTVNGGLTDTGLSMIPPETPIPDYTPTYDYSPTTAVINASPELDATGSLPQQALQAPVYDYSPNTPVQNVSPELDTTGSMVTGTSASDVANALRAANTAKNLLTSAKPTTTSTTTPTTTPTTTTQNAQALANMLKGTQMQQTALPPIYKQGNPFFYPQQQQPIQDNLASLLRNNYGNS